MSPSTTLPTGSKPNQPPPESSRRCITRVTLSNGYRAYHPQNTDGNKPPKQKKRVRFVRGHVIIPNIPYYDHQQQQQQQQQQRQATAGISRKPAGARLQPVGTARQGGGPAVWRKTPRFRGSGFVRVLDDPVAHGRELAGQAGSVWLPSDGWRDPAGGGDVGADVAAAIGALKRREEEKEEEEEEVRAGRLLLRYEEGERDAGFSLEDVVRDREAAYVVRFVVAGAASRCSKKRAAAEAGGEKEEEEEEKAAAAADETGRTDAKAGVEQGEDSDGSVALSEASSDLESEEVEYDLFRDFPLDEADGWIPVMVAEEEEGNDWMSLTGSWMRMGDMVEAFK